MIDTQTQENLINFIITKVKHKAEKEVAFSFIT